VAVSAPPPMTQELDLLITPAQALEYTIAEFLVAQGMRYPFYISQDRAMLSTIQPSEPILSLVASRRMQSSSRRLACMKTFISAFYVGSVRETKSIGERSSSSSDFPAARAVAKTTLSALFLQTELPAEAMLIKDNLEELILDKTPLKRSDFLLSRLRQEMMDLTKDWKCKTLARMRADEALKEPMQSEHENAAVDEGIQLTFVNGPIEIINHLATYDNKISYFNKPQHIAVLRMHTEYHEVSAAIVAEMFSEALKRINMDRKIREVKEPQLYTGKMDQSAPLKPRKQEKRNRCSSGLSGLSP
ncbi:hypothetical protein KEM56_007201, partial [Ascosphaera pollenicola]